MAAKSSFRGSFTALVTPFKNGSLDEKAYRGLVEWQIQEGTNGLVPVGTTGESPTLSHEEHKQAVEWCIDEARRLQVRRLMSLTYEQAFFEKLGFVVVDKDTLPLKVWSDCVRCPKREGCDEIAMVHVLADVPVVEVPLATPTPRGVSIPVLEYVEED